MTSKDLNRGRLAVIGAGASGVLAAHALAARLASVDLVMIDPDPGRGLAYGGSQALHLLNTRACNMALDSGDPGHFVDWLNRAAAEDHAWSGSDFAPRRVYGDYLEDGLRALAGAGRAWLMRDRAETLARDGAGWRV